MNSIERIKLSDELSYAMNTVIHEKCKLIESEPSMAAHDVTMVVLYALMMNLITFIDNICGDLDSKNKLLESHFESCKTVLNNISNGISH